MQPSQVFINFMLSTTVIYYYSAWKLILILVSWRVKGWVVLDTAVRAWNPCPMLRITVAVITDTTTCTGIAHTAVRHVITGPISSEPLHYQYIFSADHSLSTAKTTYRQRKITDQLNNEVTHRDVLTRHDREGFVHLVAVDTSTSSTVHLCRHRSLPLLSLSRDWQCPWLAGWSRPLAPTQWI